MQHLIRSPASLPLSAHAHRCFQAPPHESAPRPQHHARAGGHLREARCIWVRAACAYAWPRHTTHDQPRAAHVYIRAGPPEQARTAQKKARTAQKGKDRPIGLARRAASQAALLGWGLRGKPPYRRKWVWRTQLWLRRQPATRSAFFEVLKFSSLVALAGPVLFVKAELRAY